MKNINKSKKIKYSVGRGKKRQSIIEEGIRKAKSK